MNPDPTDMELGLDGQCVTRETADFAWSLVTDGGYEIRIETDVAMHTPHGYVTFSIGEGKPRRQPQVPFPSAPDSNLGYGGGIRRAHPEFQRWDTPAGRTQRRL